MKSTNKSKVSKPNDLKWLLKKLLTRSWVLNFNYVVKKIWPKKNRCFFVQIGACDGIMQDPLRKHILKKGWNGILVEPVAHLFKRLVHNYSGVPGLVFENVAIAEDCGMAALYRYKEDESELPAWHEGTGSLVKNFEERHNKVIDNVSGRLTQELVACTTFQNLIEKHDVKVIDVLCLDVEGYEYNILKTINFNRIKPSLIFYETSNLDKATLNRCETILKNAGYYLVNMGIDQLALSSRIHFIRLITISYISIIGKVVTKTIGIVINWIRKAK